MGIFSTIVKLNPMLKTVFKVHAGLVSFLTTLITSGSLFLVANPTQALNLTFNFTGEVTSRFSPNGVLDSSVAIGTPISGSYTFDSTTSDSNASLEEGRYLYSPPSRLAVTVGNYTFNASSPNYFYITVLNDFSGQDAYFITSLSVQSSIPVLSMGLGLNDISGTALSSDALLLTPPNLALFPDAQEFYIDNSVSGQEYEIGGKITSFAAVPFEFSSMIGFLFLGTWIGARKLKSLGFKYPH